MITESYLAERFGGHLAAGWENPLNPRIRGGARRATERRRSDASAGSARTSDSRASARASQCEQLIRPGHRSTPPVGVTGWITSGTSGRAALDPLDHDVELVVARRRGDDDLDVDPLRAQGDAQEGRMGVVEIVPRARRTPGP